MRLSFFAFLCFLYCVSGCGYVSTTDYLNHIDSITIAPVVIEDPDFTYQRNSGRLYNEIVRESITASFDKKWQDGNDSQLDIVIVDYDLLPISYDANNRPIQLRMKLTIDYTFTDRIRNKVIDRQDNYIQIYEFYIVQGRGEPPETIEEARERLIQELSDDFYSMLGEQW
jgi:hypothetical protein